MNLFDFDKKHDNEKNESEHQYIKSQKNGFMIGFLSTQIIE